MIRLGPISVSWNLTGSIGIEGDLELLLAPPGQSGSLAIGYYQEVDVYTGVEWSQLANMLVEHTLLLEDLRSEVAYVDDPYDVFFQSVPANLRDLDDEVHFSTFDR